MKQRLSQGSSRPKRVRTSVVRQQQPSQKYTKDLSKPLVAVKKLSHQHVADIEEANHFKCVNVDKQDANVKSPNRWTDIYNEVVLMRRKFIAPVDTMGCERIPNGINLNVQQNDPKTFRFQLLISLMLSSQTKDEVNFEAMKCLHEGLKARGNTKGLTLDAVLSISDSELDGYIGKVGFHNRKTVYIKKACQLLKDQYNGDIPQIIEDVVKLPGVGPKMGYLLLQKGWGIQSGIGVDVHLHRLSMMWGWSKKTNNPESTRKDLELWLPREYWTDINPLMVGFGQVICTPQFKNCDICTLGSNKLCKSANKSLINKGIDEARLAKLKSSRGDLAKLLVTIEQL